MIRDDDAGLLAAARAIADGDPVNWAAVESSAASESLAGILRELRVVADIADLHRTLPPISDSDSEALSPQSSASSTVAITAETPQPT